MHNYTPHISDIYPYEVCKLCMSYDRIALDLGSALTDRPVDESSFLRYMYGFPRLVSHVIWVTKSTHHVDKFSL